MKIVKTQLRLFLKFLRYLLPYRKRQILILALSGLGALVGLINPYLSKLIVDRAIVNKELNTFIFIGLIGTGVFIIHGLIKAMANILEQGLYLKVQFDINKKVFKHLQGLPLGYFQNKSTGEHMFKIDHDIQSVSDSIVSVPKELVSMVPTLFFTLAIIFYLDWQMALFALFFVPVLYVPIYYFTRRRGRVMEEWYNDSQKIFTRLQEAFSHYYLVKALGKENKEVRSYLRALIVNMRIRLKNVHLEVMSNFAGGSLNRIVIGLITLFGGYQVIRGRITLGTLTAIMIYLAQLVSLQSNLGYFGQRIVIGLISCRRLDEILQQKPKEPQKFAREKKVLFTHARIEFKKICFGYRPKEYILKDIAFNMEQGLIALVGASGCGKTTIINLILGLYDPWEGEISIDGHTLGDIGLDSLQEQVSVALQEPYLWNDTIENNIRYAKINAKKQEVIDVAKLTGVDNFVKNLPQGYGTIIGESACKLSEGQKQKIAIARALIKKPKILILDEAMSSMDSLSEDMIIRRIKQLDIAMVVIVSHRLSAVLACDRACFLECPDTLTIDRPQELLKTKKAFYDLFAAQMQDTSGEGFKKSI